MDDPTQPTEAEMLFARLADVSRKAIEDLVSNLSESIVPTGLDAFTTKYAVLMGMASANVTLLVGLLQATGKDLDPGHLQSLVDQQAQVWNQIMDRMNDADREGAAQGGDNDSGGETVQ